MTEAARQALDSIYRGSLVECSREEYPEVRRTLQEYAGRWIDQQQLLRALIALREVVRLDKEFGFILGQGS